VFQLFNYIFYTHTLYFSATRRGSSHRKAPPPPQSRPVKPKPAPKPRLPMCKTLYAYDPHEADELAFTEGEMIEIVKEGNIDTYMLLL
jgi:SH3 domain.